MRTNPTSNEGFWFSNISTLVLHWTHCDSLVSVVVYWESFFSS